MTINDATFPGWMSRGLGGLANIVEQYADDKGRITEEVLTQMVDDCERIGIALGVLAVVNGHAEGRKGD